MLVAKMMGKDFDDLADIKGDHKDKKVFSDTPVIEAKGIGHKGTIKPFDLKINKGEVIGLTGLLGSGRSELVRSIYGADKADCGTLKVNGKEVKIKQSTGCDESLVWHIFRKIVRQRELLQIFL